MPSLLSLFASSFFFEERKMAREKRERDADEQGFVFLPLSLPEKEDELYNITKLRLKILFFLFFNSSRQEV